MKGTVCVLLCKALRFLKRKMFLLLVIVIVTTPASVIADALSVAAVDQVLAATAEVVKDRAKAVAARTVAARLQSELCGGKEIKIVIDKEKKMVRTLYLGGCEKCRDSKYKKCNSDDLFVKTCRLFQADPGHPLTDPYLLKTLSRDTIGFAIRLSAYELDALEFEMLNLGPFADFVHKVMEQMAKNKADLVSLSKVAEDLIASYTGASRIYEDLLNEIAEEAGKLHKTIKGRLKDKIDNYIFMELFGPGKKFEKAINWPCAEIDEIGIKKDEVRMCRFAQLGLRLLPALDKLRKSEGGEDARKNLRNLLYVLDEDDIYIDAMKSINLSEKSFTNFSKKVREKFEDKMTDKRMTQATIGDSLRLIGSVALALGVEHEEAIKWLKQFQKELSAKKEDSDKWEIDSFAKLRSAEPLNWLNRKNLPPHTRKMRDNFKQMLVTPQFCLYRWKKEGQNFQRMLDLAQELSNAFVMLTTGDYSGRSVEDMVRQLALFVGQMSSVIKKTGDDLEKEMKKKKQGVEKDKIKGNIEQLNQLVHALNAFSIILKHAYERDWVAVGLDITEQLQEHEAEIHAQRSIAFVRILLSMYQAETVEEAKGIFDAALVNETSRERRYDQWTLDVAALPGLRVSYVSYRRDEDKFDENNNTETSSGLGYGIFAPLGVQVARGWLGMLIYPVDLGGYLSGSLADESPEIRLQSALHSGLAVYLRVSSRTPIVLGTSADYKPQFDNEDSEEYRASIFIALELPLYIIR